MIMYPAAKHSVAGVILVATAFGAVTCPIPRAVGLKP
jgi:hypothetical protein